MPWPENSWPDGILSGDFMHPIKAGWRWLDGGLRSTKEWEREDGSMNGLTARLEFTVETEEDFGDGWLLTLGFKIRINAQNIIEYAFYEKPTASNRCLQADTALNHNCLIRSLANEVGRRLDAFSETVNMG